MHEVEHDPDPARTRLLLSLVCALQVALAVWAAAHKSLVQDELHTHFHATAASVGELFADLRSDNHPPLGFLLVRASHAVLGDSELALRTPMILCGLIGTLLITRLCRRLGAPVVVGAAAWALSSTQLEFSSQSRMYALSALCCAGALNALAGLVAEGPPSARDRVELGLWVAAGLLTHYYWLFYAAALALALVAAAGLGPRGRAPGARAGARGSSRGSRACPGTSRRSPHSSRRDSRPGWCATPPWMRSRPCCACSCGT